MISISEAARLAGVGDETVRRWVRSGRLEHRRDGPRLLVYRDQVEQLALPPSLPLPASWQRTAAGAPQPDWVAALRRSRRGTR